MEKKPKSTTLTTYKKYKALKYGLFAGTFICPVIPATVLTAINWQEWFNKTSVSLPFGFACLLVTVITAIVGVLKSDTVFKKADIALFYLAGIFVLIGLTCMFLASLFSQMGYLWLYTSSGLLGGGVCATVEKKVVEPLIGEYAELISEFALDKKSKRKQERMEKARKEAEAEANYQATE